QTSLYPHISLCPPLLLMPYAVSIVFLTTATKTSATDTLSLHDALPISWATQHCPRRGTIDALITRDDGPGEPIPLVAFLPHPARDRKSTRLNSSHVSISYAVFLLNKKKRV